MDVWWFPTIFYIKIWNHPIETTIYKWLGTWGFQVCQFNHPFMSNLQGKFFSSTELPARRNTAEVEFVFLPSFIMSEFFAKSPREDSNLQEVFPKTSNPTPKKRILRTPTMFRRLPGVLEDRAAIREIVLQNVEKKETAKALRALHRCPPRDVWWFQKCSNSNQLQLGGVFCPLYQKIFAKMRKQTSICELKFTKKTASIEWYKLVGPEVLGSTNLPIYFSISNTCEKKMGFS